MKEAGFWSDRVRPLLKRACFDVGAIGTFERVENNVGNGTPDVDYCIAAVPGKIENKYAGRHPARASTPVLGRGKGMRKSQIVWATKYKRAGGVVFLCIGTPLTTWFIDLRNLDPAQMRAVELMGVPELSKISQWKTGDAPASLIRLLTRMDTHATSDHVRERPQPVPPR